MSVENIITLTDVEAEARQAKLKLSPQGEDLYNEALKLARARHFHSAYIALARAVALCPQSGVAHAALASALWNLGRYDEALKHSDRALALIDPDDPVPFADAGVLRSSIGMKEQALDLLKRAVELQPDNVHAKWSYALSLLDHGEWEEGFKQYECRPEWRGRKYYPKMPFPMWEGEPLDGKTLYVQAEQGIGDRILLSRYLAWIKTSWPTARLIFLASSPDQIHLESLFWNYKTEYGIEFLHPQIPWPEADFGIYMGSLPRIHKTRPDFIPFDPGCIRRRCQQEADLIEMPEPLVPSIKVGISWTGNANMVRNDERSIPPELLFELECDPLVQLYSLQFGNDGLKRCAAGALICDAASDIGDRGMLGTASVMLNLDLVITCCTANAHLAGALDVPTWVLLCDDPYWIWMREREDSPWYPSVRLFRQQQPGEWRGVIDRVKDELHAFAERLLTERATKEQERSHG